MKTSFVTKIKQSYLYNVDGGTSGEGFILIVLIGHVLLWIAMLQCFDVYVTFNS